MKRALIAIAALAALYVILVYIVLPTLWTHHERQPRLANRVLSKNSIRPGFVSGGRIIA
jgi:hypothetical protein